MPNPIYPGALPKKGFIPSRVPPKFRPKPVVEPPVAQGEPTPRATTNGTATGSAERKIMTAAVGAPIPIIYGTEVVGAKIAAVAVRPIGGRTYLLCVWCLGEIDAVEAVYYDGVDKTILGTHYTGTTGQGVDPDLALYIAGYTDTLTGTFNGEAFGVAYSVMRLAGGQPIPQITAKIRGKKCYDPRTLLTAYSDNPAICLADFIESKIYGKGVPVNTQSVIDAANYNDVELSPGIKRRTLALSVDKPSSVDSWIDSLRPYAGVFVIQDDGGDLSGGVKLVLDAPVANILLTPIITESNIVEQSFLARKLSLRNATNAVKVIYSDPNNGYRDREATAEIAAVTAGTQPRREAVYRLPGFGAYDQAYREAVYRLNYAQLCTIEMGFVLHDEALEIETGDVIRVTHGVGFALKPMRITRMQQREIGRWNVECREYQDSVYSDAIEPEPTFPDTTLPNANAPPNVLNLAAVFETFEVEPGVTATRIRITWDDLLSYPYLLDYSVIVQLIQFPNVIPIFDTYSSTVEVTTGALEPGLTYFCNVAVRSITWALGEYETVTAV